MRENEPSLTAMAVSFTRALHLYVDDEPAVLKDPVAFRLLPAYQRRYLRRLARLSYPWLRQYRRRLDALTPMRAQIVLRQRYAEDALASARREGVSRYVVLAAGLDTFAFRQPRPPIPVVEIDHPATQRWKRELLEKNGLEPPAELDFLALDFETMSITSVWPDSGEPDFLAWLGTTYYLSRNAVAATLRALAECVTPGSHLVLDYWRENPPRVADNILLWAARIAVALQQEPIESLFDPEEIEDIAISSGWRVIENLDSNEQNARYLTGRRDGLSIPSFAHLLHLQHQPRAEVEA